MAIEVPARATVEAQPLSYDAFKPYGRVVQGWQGTQRAPSGINVTEANQGTAFKFHRLAPLVDSGPTGKRGVVLSGKHVEAVTDVRNGGVVSVNKLESHTTRQGALPLGRGVQKGEEPIKAGGAHVVVVALPTSSGEPDLNTLKAFLATAAQGVLFDAGVWHAPLTPVNEALDFTLVDAAPGQSSSADASIEVSVPAYTSVAPPEIGPSCIPPTGTQPSSTDEGILQPVPITPEAFAPYGEICSARIPGSTATLINTYPAEDGAVTAIGVFRATPKEGLHRGRIFDIHHMERHPFTSQSFVPMSKATWEGKTEPSLPSGGTFLVVVADNGKDDRPDPATVKTFIMESGTALNYKAGVWHHPVLVLDGPLDLACVETQVGKGDGISDPRDCELITYDEVFRRVAVPDVAKEST